jgi:hypothetical protein
MQSTKHYLLPYVAWRGYSDDELTLSLLRRNIRSTAVTHYWQAKRKLSRIKRKLYRKEISRPRPRFRRRKPLAVFKFKRLRLKERIGQSSQSDKKNSLFFKLGTLDAAHKPLI